MKTNKIVVFDCDGTLLNTFPLIMESFRRTFKEFIPEHKLTEDELVSFFGPSLRLTFSKYVSEDKVDYVMEEYRKISRRLMPTWTRAFPGIVDLLDYLYENNYRISILSNKAYDMIMYGLELTRIDRYFDIVIGYDQMDNPKPSPDGINVIKRYYHQDNNIYLIGDTAIDILTGKNATNVKTVGVTWCNTKYEEFKKLGADYIINHPLELINILEE